MSDVDEFLCSQANGLRSILKQAVRDDVTALKLPCHNMTGSPTSGEDPLTLQTPRIDQPVTETYEQQLSGDVPVPYIFVRHPPKTIVRASAFAEYGPGTHYVITGWGKTIELPELRILHYPIRGFDKFQTKVANAAAFFDQNTHLEPWWSWHWRRWIRLNREGRLREEYESQFLSPARAQELVRDGICTVDETIANWIKNKNSAARL